MASDEAAVHDGGTADQGEQSAFDTSVAHQARVYDYLLGGKDNYAADRAAAESWLQVNPDTVFTARANRGGAVSIVNAAGSQSGTSCHLSGIDTRASAVGRTEYAEATVRSLAFWL